MSRLKDLRKYVNKELLKMSDEDKRTGAIVHLYGVSLAATMIAKKRGLDPELAREILGKLELTTEEETETICSAIYHHDDKYAVDAPMDEVLKDADVIHHCMNDLSKKVKDKEKARYASLCEEFGM